PIRTSDTTAGCKGGPDGQKLGTPSLWFDPCVFILPPAGTFGNLAKNAVIGPPLADFDFAMRKQFNVSERTNLQFRAEAFNLFNHPNFGNMITPIFAGSTGARNGSAGRIFDTATPPRKIHFEWRLVFKGTWSGFSRAAPPFARSAARARQRRDCRHPFA